MANSATARRRPIRITARRSKTCRRRSNRSGRSSRNAGRLDDPLPLIAAIAKKLPKDDFAMFALSALDQAIHDLWGKLRGAPVYRLWGLSTDKVPMSDYTLGIDTPEKMVAKLHEMPGWPVYKIKLGTDDDLAILRELRRHTDAMFRVDANCGWTAEQTIELSAAMKEMGVEFIEQPLPAGGRGRCAAGVRALGACR